MSPKTELLNKILYLNEDAQFSVTDIDNRGNVEDGQSKFVELDGLLVIWNPNNSTSPPTQEELNNLDTNDVTLAAEARRKRQRDASYQNNTTVKIGLQVAQATDPSITLSQYLDNLGL